MVGDDRLVLEGKEQERRADQKAEDARRTGPQQEK
jgi:hypothetical protein